MLEPSTPSSYSGRGRKRNPSEQGQQNGQGGAPRGSAAEDGRNRSYGEDRNDQRWSFASNDSDDLLMKRDPVPPGGAGGGSMVPNKPVVSSLANAKCKNLTSIALYGCVGTVLVFVFLCTMHNGISEISVANVYVRCLLCTGLPGGGMFFAVVYILCLMGPGEYRENALFMAKTQFFSAGILIGAVAVELVPKLVQHPKNRESTVDSLLNSLSVGVGFFGGVGFHMGIEKLVEDLEQSGDAGRLPEAGAVAVSRDEDNDNALTFVGRGLLRLNSTTRSRLPKTASTDAAVGAGEEDRTRGVLSFPERGLSAGTRHLSALAGGSGGERSGKIPWASISPILVDCCVDGLLIGLVAHVSLHAGLICALATCVEMSFLGLTLGGFLKPCLLVGKTVGGLEAKANTTRVWLVAALAPFLLITSGILTTIFSSFLTAHPQVLLAMMSFGTAALVFLVTNELIPTARTNMEMEHVHGDGAFSESPTWRTRIFLFLGFFSVLCTERLVPDD